MDIVRKIENAATNPGDKPVKEVLIVQSGEIPVEADKEEL